MYKGVACSMYGDKLILTVSAMCNILNIHNFHNCNDEFIIMFDHLFFLGLEVYLFTRDYWYGSWEIRVECLSDVADCSTMHVVLSC